MIVPMKKVSLIVLNNERQQVLKKLRHLGLLHIEITEGSGERLVELGEKIKLLENSIFTVSEKTKKNTEQQKLTKVESIIIGEKVAKLSEEKKSCQGEKISYNAELERLKNWGNIDIEEISSLEEKGIGIGLYEMPVSEYENISDSVKTLVLERTKNSVRFLLIKSETDVEEIHSLEGYRIQLPEMSTSEMENKIAVLDKRIQEIDELFISYCVYLDSMKDAIETLKKEIEFETYNTGMEGEILSENSQKNVSVAYFSGYIPTEDLEKLTTTAKENAWGLLIEDPTEEDNVPTKLKNNKFVSLIYPLTDFLGTVPGYFEYDISGWFLGFILIFFGIIFGDGGYGLLISAVALILIIKSYLKEKTAPPTFLLIGLLGCSTILWGTLTCTWFGLAPEQLPEWLRSISIPFISNVYEDKIWQPFWVSGDVGLTTAQNLQIFCFSLALVQLTVAHIKGAVRNRKSIKMLGDIGSILQLVGIFYVVLTLVVNGEVFGLGLVIGGVPIGTISIALVGVGFVMSFIFANYEGSIIKSILESLKNIVSVLLGVVNVFSDIVSYIRLWAVGLAGAAISATVNELAGPLLGNFLFMIIAIILLVFGHGLNMILNVLSVIVHGIRLNTLEFSSHLDMSWSGHKYKPFEE